MQCTNIETDIFSGKIVIGEKRNGVMTAAELAIIVGDIYLSKTDNVFREAISSPPSSS